MHVSRPASLRAVRAYVLSCDMAPKGNHVSAKKRSAHAKATRATKRSARKKASLRPIHRPLAGTNGTPNGARTVSPFATEALTLFKQGVRRQLAMLAKKGVSTVAVIDGAVVRGVPTRVGHLYVLEQPLKSTRGKRRIAKH
jgi:hypothetical protein